MSAQPSLPTLPNGTADILLKKGGHLIAYAMLALFWTRAMPGSWSVGRAMALAILLTAAYGAADEFHQSFVPGRTPRVIDWLIDSAGAGAGSVLYAVLCRSPFGRSQPGGGRS
jgi:VanZ family protein